MYSPVDYHQIERLNDFYSKSSWKIGTVKCKRSNENCRIFRTHTCTCRMPSVSKNRGRPRGTRVLRLWLSKRNSCLYTIKDWVGTSTLETFVRRDFRAHTSNREVARGLETRDTACTVTPKKCVLERPRSICSNSKFGHAEILG